MENSSGNTLYSVYGNAGFSWPLVASAISLNVPAFVGLFLNSALIWVNQSAFAQALQFLNRYLIVCRNSSNKFCRSLIHAVLNIVIFTIVLLIILFSPPKSTASIVDPRFEGILIIGDLDMHENFPLKIVFMLFAILLLTGHLMTIVCFFRIRAFLKANIWNVINGLDRKTLHKIILSMLVQAFVPIYNFALAGVCVVIIITGHYDSDLLKQLILFFFIIINWLPILNPIATILTIREYRLQMLDILRLRQGKATTTIIVLKQMLKQQQPAPPRST